MKKLILALALLLICGQTLLFGQATRTTPPERTQRPDTSQLPRFSLDFQGGTPQDLVDEIRKQIEVLNAIIPVEHAHVQLPPFKMQQVNVSELFHALTAASQGSVSVPVGSSSDGRTIMNTVNTQYGFTSSGVPTPETVWHFFSFTPPKVVETKAYRFYQLAPYLGTLTVEDITTAIQAGWKMMGETNTPALNYHKETKLLIAVGKPEHLSMISAVLAELPKAPTTSQQRPAQATLDANAPTTTSKTNKF